jgi:hypothetical protein
VLPALLDWAHLLEPDATLDPVMDGLGVPARRARGLALRGHREFCDDPELPWADMAGAGSVYRHDYEDVRERRLWSALQKDLAPLLAVVEQELSDLGELP